MTAHLTFLSAGHYITRDPRGILAPTIKMNSLTFSFIYDLGACTFWIFTLCMLEKLSAKKCRLLHF